MPRALSKECSSESNKPCQRRCETILTPASLLENQAVTREIFGDSEALLLRPEMHSQPNEQFKPS
jgi:hypothetical protein